MAEQQTTPGGSTSLLDGSPEPADAPTGAPASSPSGAACGPLDIEALRHPTEGTRLALALVASATVLAGAVAIVVASGGLATIVVWGVSIGFAFLVILAAVQLWRVRLLADGAQVSATTLPELHAVVERVRDRLDYHRRIDVFVVDKVSRVFAADAPPITLTSYFGVDVIVAEGSAVGDLSKKADRQQLQFALATQVGALKARHTTWTPFLLALELVNLTRFVTLFILPWRRATHYTGDRIAYACCGDLDVALQAVYRLLVGKEVAPHLRPTGLAAQALVVRRRFVLRVAQLLRPVPHATNRYLELLAFAAAHEDEPTMRAATGVRSAEVDVTLRALGRKRPHPAAVPVALVVAVALLAGGAWAGSEARDVAGPEPAPAPEPEPDPPAPDPPAPEPPPPPVDEPVDPPEPDDADILLALVPDTLRGGCEEVEPGFVGATAALTCGGDQFEEPLEVSYVAFVDTVDLTTAFDDLTAGLLPGDCSQGAGLDSWTLDDVERGPLACWTTAEGRTRFAWGDEELAVLAVAGDPALSIPEVYEWWTENGALAGTGA